MQILPASPSMPTWPIREIAPVQRRPVDSDGDRDGSRPQAAKPPGKGLIFDIRA